MNAEATSTTPVWSTSTGSCSHRAPPRRFITNASSTASIVMTSPSPAMLSQ